MSLFSLGEYPYTLLTGEESVGTLYHGGIVIPKYTNPEYYTARVQEMAAEVLCMAILAGGAGEYRLKIYIENRANAYSVAVIITDRSEKR